MLTRAIHSPGRSSGSGAERNREKCADCYRRALESASAVAPAPESWCPEFEQEVGGPDVEAGEIERDEWEAWDR